MNKIYLMFLFASLVFFGCSSTQETIKEETPKEETTQGEVYVFDEIPTDTVKLESVENSQVVIAAPSVMKYYVQIGAFTTKEKAQTFAKGSRKTLGKEVFIKYSPDVELFIVTLAAFDAKLDAEKLRGELWKKKEFQDAFILIIEESEQK